MNSANAFGFLGFGAVMWLLPILAPQWFPAQAVDGSSTRELWVQVMGLTQAVLGLAFLVRPTLQAFGRAVDLLHERVARGATMVAGWESEAERAGAMAIDLIAGMPAPALVGANRKLLEDGRLEPLVWHAAGGQGLWATPVHEPSAVARQAGWKRTNVRGIRPIATATFQRRQRTSFVHLNDLNAPPPVQVMGTDS